MRGICCRTISASTPVIHGSHDAVVPVGNAHLLVERIPWAELHIVQGRRDAFLLEYQQESSREVLNCLLGTCLRTTATHKSSRQPR